MHTKVSVIIPTYNCAQYITEAIKSVLNQTYNNIEIIVVDDGSTDNTREVLEPCISKSLIRFIRQENRGPGAARNTGINAAKGEYICFLDADDSLTQDSLEKRLDLIEGHPEVDIVFSDFYNRHKENENRRFLKEIGFLDKLSKRVVLTPGGVIFTNCSAKDIFEISFNAGTGTVLVRKAVFERAGLFRTDIAGHEDNDMWLRVLRQCKAGYIDEPLAYYNRFRSNLTLSRPLKYSQDRLNYLRPLLRENLGDWGVRRTIKKRLSWVYYDLASYYYTHDQKTLSRKNCLRSICSDPRNQLAYKFLLLSLIPKKLRVRLKKLSTTGVN